MNEEFLNRVYIVVEKIPKGKVCTYGYIAALCGAPGYARQVGYAMRKASDRITSYGEPLPCHRVVNRSGEMCGAFGGKDIQRKMLEKEGITFSPSGRINMKLHMWNAASLL